MECSRKVISKERSSESRRYVGPDEWRLVILYAWSPSRLSFLSDRLMLGEKGVDIQIAMKGYREAFYPPAPRSPSPPGLSPLHTSPALPPLDGIDDVPESDDGMPRARPLFARREEEEEEDGPDMDELMAMEEMEREVGNVQGKSAPNGQANGHTNGAPAPDVPEEDEWEGLYDWSVFARLAPSGSS